MILRKEVLFHCSAAKAWDLIINPEMTAQYMFGCAILSDWNIGSPAIWKGKNAEGDDMIFVKGVVLSYREGSEVSMTMFDPNMGLEDIPENYAKLTYQVEPADDGARLTIIQDFTGVEKAQSRHDESEKGWDALFPIMKGLVEQ